jgi:AraC-like DNA-binding protein
MRYREYPPPADLREWVQCLWTMEAAAPGLRSHRVLPDGCIDVLFEVTAARRVDSYVVGMMTRPLVVERTALLHFTAVRFRPGGAAAFWREPLFRFTDARVELREVWTRPAGFAERLAAEAAPAGRVELLIAELRRRLAANAGSWRCHPGCRLAIRQLVQRPETAVRDLCSQLGMSRQALARSFREHVGISPKTLGRVLRLQRALHLIESPESIAGDLLVVRGEDTSHGGHDTGSDRAGGCTGAVRDAGGCRGRAWSLADLAAAAGFYDQSHMVAEWRELVGLTPSGFLAERAELAPGEGRVPFFQDGASRPQ